MWGRVRSLDSGEDFSIFYFICPGVGGRVNHHPEFLSTLYIILQNTDYVPTLSFYSHLVCLVLGFLTCKTERKLLPCSFSLRDKWGNEWKSPLWAEVPQRARGPEGPLTTRWQSGGMEFVHYFFEPSWLCSSTLFHQYLFLSHTH